MGHPAGMVVVAERQVNGKELRVIVMFGFLTLSFSTGSS
jgi:hypothetical protein